MHFGRRTRTMPAMQSESPPLASPGQDIQFTLKEQERVQDSAEKLIRKYTLDEVRGLGIPTSLGQFNHESQRLVVATPETAKSIM